MKLWPWKLLRRAECEALREAAATGELDNAEATALAAERDKLREDRNQLLSQRADLQIRVQDLTKELSDSQAEYGRLQEEADTRADKLDGLSIVLPLRDEEITQLQAQLADARHGAFNVYVLQSKGAPITAARSREGAIKAAQIFGLPAEGWGPWDGTRTDDWSITPIQLVAEEPQRIPSQQQRR